jgi:hypothetical protein
MTENREAAGGWTQRKSQHTAKIKTKIQRTTPFFSLFSSSIFSFLFSSFIFTSLFLLGE